MGRDECEIFFHYLFKRNLMGWRIFVIQFHTHFESISFAHFPPFPNLPIPHLNQTPLGELTTFANHPQFLRLISNTLTVSIIARRNIQMNFEKRTSNRGQYTPAMAANRRAIASLSLL